MKNYVQEGDTIPLVAPTGGVVAGVAYKIGSFIAVAATTQAAGANFEGGIDGVYDLASDTGTAWAQGDQVYYDAVNLRFTKTATSNTRAGLVTEPKQAGDLTGRILLIPALA